MQSSVQRGGYSRDYPPPQNRYTGPQNMGPPRPLRKCYYCFGGDHIFLNCPIKLEDEQKGLILMDGFTVRSTNGDPVPVDPNLPIQKCVKKHLPPSVAVILMGDPDPELTEFLDREPDTGYNYWTTPRTILKRPQNNILRAESPQPEIVQLKNKVKSLEVILQKLQTENEPEEEEEDIEGLLRQVAAEYTQLKGAPRKKPGF